MAMMAAEVLGLPVEQVRPVVADTASIGYSMLTGGSRTTFAIGMAVIQAAEKVVDDLKRRAAGIWDVSGGPGGLGERRGRLPRPQARRTPSR